MRRNIINTLSFLTILIFVSSCFLKSKETCDICGYVALKNGKCGYCGNPQWDESMGMPEDEYIKSKQLEWFYVPGMKVNFYGPKEVTDFIDEKVYKKDSLWEPMVTVEEVKKANKNIE